MWLACAFACALGNCTIKNAHYSPGLLAKGSNAFYSAVIAGFIPCLEFAEPDQAYTASGNCIRFGTGEPGYYDNRYDASKQQQWFLACTIIRDRLCRCWC